MTTIENYGVILFVEGDTEEEFYRYLIAWLKLQGRKLKTVGPVIIKNLHGIGGFKRIALRYYLTKIVPQQQARRFYVVLAYDTDVFEYSGQPPVDWQKVEYVFRAYGAADVLHIKQQRMIEDWFLIDLIGLCRYLGLPLNTVMPAGRNANEKMQQLFSRANRIYYKGHYTKRFLDELNIGLIYNQLHQELKPLENLLFINVKEEEL